MFKKRKQTKILCNTTQNDKKQQTTTTIKQNVDLRKDIIEMQMMEYNNDDDNYAGNDDDAGNDYYAGNDDNKDNKDVNEDDLNIQQNGDINKKLKERQKRYQFPGKLKKINKFSTNYHQKVEKGNYEKTTKQQHKSQLQNKILEKMTEQKKQENQQDVEYQDVEKQQQNIKANQITNHHVQNKIINHYSLQQTIGSRTGSGSYGLIDKNHFKSINERQDQEDYDQGMKKRTKTGNIQGQHQSVLLDIYVKKKMNQLKAKKQQQGQLNVSQAKDGSSINTYTLKEKSDWQEILQMQKQYLVKEQKIKDYDMTEVQKKLQKLARSTIKKQVEARASYLKDLLENQHQKLEYASKKQLKMVSQEKQRIQRQLNSKYRDGGRKQYIEKIKNNNLF